MDKTIASDAPETVSVPEPRSHTKAARLLELLRTRTGVSLEEMSEATGWQSHTVRAAMTGLRRKGLAITRHVEGNTTVWHVASEKVEGSA